MCRYQLLVPSHMVCSVCRAPMLVPPVPCSGVGLGCEDDPASFALAASAVSLFISIIRAASLAVASAVRRDVLAATFLPAAFSAALCVGPVTLTLSALKVPGHKTAGMPVVGVAGAVAGENLNGLPLPAAAFTLARSFGIVGLALRGERRVSGRIA